jgi:NLI interacting factor-like phosphatase
MQLKALYLAEPPSDMLLPDQHPLQQAHKLRTLVLDVDDVLVQSTWSRGVGWKTFKRPGASDFLDVLCRQYELVVFANRSHSYVDPILNRVDPGIVRGDGPTIAYRLYKNANSIRVWMLGLQLIACVQDAFLSLSCDLRHIRRHFLVAQMMLLSFCCRWPCCGTVSVYQYHVLQ